MALVLLAGAIACEVAFQQYPKQLAGLTPLQVPIANSETVRASFTAVWSEPHHLALVFSASADPGVVTLLDQASSSIGSLTPNSPGFDFDWRALTGNRGWSRVRPRSGHRCFRFARTRGLIFGEFPVIAGKTYDVEVQPGPAFARMVRLKPMIEVGVNTAGPSIGLPWVKDSVVQ